MQEADSGITLRGTMRYCVSRGVGVCVALATLSCGQDSTSPRHGVYVTVVSGSGQRDTIGATLTQALVLQIAGTSSVAGRQVLFTTAGLAAAVQSQGSSCDASTSSNCRFIATSDSRGRVAVIITFLNTAVPASVIATVLDPTSAPAGSPDTVRFTIDPGRAAGIVISPTDTAMFVGATLVLHAYALDRAGNRRTDTLRYGASGPVTVSDSIVTATATGRAAVAVRDAGVSATAYISVVPNGTIAMTTSDQGRLGMGIMDLDGSHYRHLPVTGTPLRTSWAPSGAWIAYDYNADPQLGIQRVALIDTAGKQWPADTNTLHYADIELSAQYSRDGRWLYFTRAQSVNPPFYAQIWRVGADSNARPVPNQAPTWDYSPSASPDGSQVAYVGGPSGGDPATLKILNVATGAVTDLGVMAQTPRWAPQGQTIAYIAAAPGGAFGTLSVIHADGSNPHAIGPSGTSYEYWMDWSPDGQWIIAYNGSYGHLDVINVASGIALPLAFTNEVTAPTWRPTTH